MVSDLYKLHTPMYKFLFYQSVIYQHFTKSKYKSQNLDINGFL